MKNKGFGLIGILISVAIIALLISGIYYSNPDDEAGESIKDEGGAQNIILDAEKAKSQLERNFENSDN